LTDEAAELAAPFTAYLAADGFRDELVAELGEVGEIYGNLVLAAGPARPAAWAQNIWYEPRLLPIASIGDAARQLRGIQRNWALYAHDLHRRAALIAEKLPPVSRKPLRFGDPVPPAPLGSWTLRDAATLIAAPRCSSQFANGAVDFVEDRLAPPSRAYLKLWEALTLSGARPAPGDLCLDLGASPGGWTWVLQSLGARIVSIDKAPLDPAIAALPGVEHRRQSAFALDPQALGPVDWLVSDVICYPARLYRLIEAFLAAGTCRNFVSTLKFQGATDHATSRRFAAIPGSQLLHLSHNKHELTWLKIGQKPNVDRAG
jgi:23S rRNA (cytidine2498-2'-O)-methyltransferase